MIFQAEFVVIHDVPLISHSREVLHFCLCSLLKFMIGWLFWFKLLWNFKSVVLAELLIDRWPLLTWIHQHLLYTGTYDVVTCVSDLLYIHYHSKVWSIWFKKKKTKNIQR